MRGAVPTYVVQHRRTELTEPDVVDEDVQDVRRLATVPAAERRELLVDRAVIHGPLLAVLGFEDVVLRVVDNVRTDHRSLAEVNRARHRARQCHSNTDSLHVSASP